MYLFDRVVAAIGIAREIRLAHATYQMPDTPPIGDGCGEREEHQVAAGHEGIGKALLAETYFLVAGQRRFGNFRQTIERHEMIVTQSFRPAIIDAAHRPNHRLLARDFDAMTLTVIEGDGFNVLETLKRPG